jgi:hypothetical protein
MPDAKTSFTRDIPGPIERDVDKGNALLATKLQSVIG